jgi:predicted ribosome quality control (RQC) complex YloA/Tae2 family protein
LIAYDSVENKVSMLPKSFNQASGLKPAKEVSTYQDAVKAYISEYYHNFEFYKLKKELDSFFDKEMHRLSEKINKLKHRIELGSKESEYRKLGNILLANIHLFSKGLKKITLNDYETGEQVEIKLKETNTPNENANLYFDKAKDEKINFSKSKEVYETSLKSYNSLSEKHKIYLNAGSVDELRELRKELKIGSVKKIKKETKLDIKYKQYRIDDMFDLYVGKDSRSNDLLSIKFAKQNDYWFHARGMPGSHVILRSDTPKEVVPKPVLKKAASIAAYHSKAKTAGIVPVSYTFAKFVYKKKGMEPGQVFLSKEKVLTVQPGIPTGCELVNE